LEMSGNMFCYILLCLVGLKNMQAFHVAGDCHDLLEGHSSWEGGDSWGMKAAAMGSPDWSLLLEFDKPLQGLQVYNGDMDTEDMRQFKIIPEKYLRHHTGPVDVYFLVKYKASHPPAKLQYINVNGKTHYCKEGLGEGASLPRSGRIPSRGIAQFRTQDIPKVNQDSIAASADHKWINAAESQVQCEENLDNNNAGDGTYTCTKTSILTFKETLGGATCPPDVFPTACGLFDFSTTAKRKTLCKTGNTKDFMVKFCYKTCFCPASG